MRWSNLVGAAALAFAIGAPAAAEHDDAPPNSTIVIVLAHPDDELVFAPAIHGWASAGHRVELVFATRGDQGPGVSGMAKGDDLALARTREAECSGKALGSSGVALLNLGDGALADHARNRERLKHNLQWVFLQSKVSEANTVITWGPDGGYGHADHRMISAFVTQLVQAMPAEARPTLLYPTLIHTPLPEPLANEGWAITAPDLATVRYRYNDADLTAAAGAVQCHQTQFDAATRAVFASAFHATVWKGEVAFRKAF